MHRVLQALLFVFITIAHSTAVFAREPGSGSVPRGTFFSILDEITRSLTLLLPIALGVALLFFFYATVQFIRASGGDEARSEGRQQMVWGIVALFIIVSVWGIVGFLGIAFGVGQGGACTAPSLNGNSVSTCF